MQVLSFHNKGKRTYQEDFYYVDPDHRFFILCDGIGGRKGGAIASKLVVESISYKMKSLGDDITLSKLESVIDIARNVLLHTAHHGAGPSDMGTTLAMLYLDKKNMLSYIAHVGDSRVYHIQHSRDSYWVTKDHSVVQELFDADVINTQDAMKSHPLKNRITRAISTTERDKDYEESIVSRPYSKGDLFLLCTDGAFEGLTSDELVNHFSSTKRDVKEQFEMHKLYCNENSNDNNTLILIQV